MVFGAGGKVRGGGGGGDNSPTKTKKKEEGGFGREGESCGWCGMRSGREGGEGGGYIYKHHRMIKNWRSKKIEINKVKTSKSTPITFYVKRYRC